MSAFLTHSNQEFADYYYAGTRREGKKKVKKTPEPVGRDALGLMIDDFRLMIVGGGG